MHRTLTVMSTSQVFSPAPHHMQKRDIWKIDNPLFQQLQTAILQLCKYEFRNKNNIVTTDMTIRKPKSSKYLLKGLVRRVFVLLSW